MRELSDDEKDSFYNYFTCPFCAGRTFRFGPQGGASVNVFCARCEAGFNVTLLGAPFGQLIKEPDPNKCQ